MASDITPLADDEIAALWMAAYPDEYPDTDPTAPDRALAMVEYIFELDPLRDFLARVIHQTETEIFQRLSSGEIEPRP
jgi:hypothetical protein